MKVYSKYIYTDSRIDKYFWSGNLDDIKEYCEKDVLGCIEVSKLIY